MLHSDGSKTTTTRAVKKNSQAPKKGAGPVIDTAYIFLKNHHENHTCILARLYYNV